MTKIDIKRLAMQIVSQLPDEPDDALLVLKYAHDLVQDFLGLWDARRRKGGGGGHEPSD